MAKNILANLPHKFQYNNDHKVEYNKYNMFHFSVTHTVILLPLIYLQVFLCCMESAIYVVICPSVGNIS